MDYKSTAQKVTIVKNTQPIVTEEQNLDSNRADQQLALASMLPVNAEPSSK